MHDQLVSSPHALDRFMARFVDFEVDAADFEGAEGAEDVEAAADPEASEPSAAAEESPEAAAWAPDPAEWQQLNETQARTQQVLEQLVSRFDASSAPEDDTEALIEAYEEASLNGDVRTQLAIQNELIGRQIAAAMTPVQSTIASVEHDRADKQIGAWLAEAKVEKPEHQQAAVILANGLLPRDKDGRPTVAAGQEKQILDGAVGYMNNLIAAERKAAVEEYKASLNGQTSDGGPAGGGGGLEIVEVPDTYDGIIAKYAATIPA